MSSYCMLCDYDMGVNVSDRTCSLWTSEWAQDYVEGLIWGELSSPCQHGTTDVKPMMMMMITVMFLHWKPGSALGKRICISRCQISFVVHILMCRLIFI